MLHEHATTNVAVLINPDRAWSSPKFLFFFHGEKPSTPMKFLFVRTTDDYELSPKHLFMKN
jgi:hypothetical protein